MVKLMSKKKIFTNGERLSIAIHSYDLLELTTFGDKGSEDEHKQIILDEEKHSQSKKVSEILQPFLDKQHPWYPIIKSTLKNTESQQDFDPTQLFEFRLICIEALEYYLTEFTTMLSHSEEYKQAVEEVSKLKNKMPKTTKIIKDIVKCKKDIEQITRMVDIFSNAKTPTDLKPLELDKL